MHIDHPVHPQKSFIVHREGNFLLFPSFLRISYLSNESKWGLLRLHSPVP
jgi:hypothetical protein